MEAQHLVLSEHVLKLLASLVCGVLIGLERERRDKPAGLRTIVLITVGSTLFMIVGELAAVVTKASGSAQPDPTRIGSEVVAGIGFLGAGSIIQSRGSIHGLTTAATIWVASAVGLCIGIGYYFTAFATCVVVLGVLTLLDPLAQLVRGRHVESTLRFHSRNDTVSIETLRLVLLEHGVPESFFEHRHEDEKRLWTVRSNLRGPSQLRLLEALRKLDIVSGVPPEES